MQKVTRDLPEFVFEDPGVAAEDERRSADDSPRAMRKLQNSTIRLNGLFEKKKPLKPPWREIKTPHNQTSQKGFLVTNKKKKLL